MSRLIVHVEGQTEETFVNEVLRPHLVNARYHEVQPRIFGSARIRGGVVAWPVAKKEIVTRLQSDGGCVVTTMVDYYGMPQSAGKAWPGRDTASALTSAQARVTHVQGAIRDDVAAVLGKRFDQRRFVPYVMMHEFEAMLFSDCTAFANAIGRTDLRSPFQQIREAFETPEEINDSASSAPSKRIAAICPEYQKPLFGNLAILEIGLQAVRRQCPNFSQWLSRLESSAM